MIHYRQMMYRRDAMRNDTKGYVGDEQQERKNPEME